MLCTPPLGTQLAQQQLIEANRLAKQAMPISIELCELFVYP
jgi:hypothetical protein